MKNWKTTLGSIVAALGLACQSSSDERVKLIGWIVASIGTVYFGVNATDSKVTDGTKPQ